MFLRCSFILSLILLAPRVFADQKSDLLKNLRKVQESYSRALSEVNKLMISQILATQTVHITNKGEKQAQHSLDNSVSQIEDINVKMHELKQRIYLVDRLIFQTDSKYTNGQNPKTFFAQQLLDMSYTELASSTATHGAEFPIWKFMIYFSVAIREIHNPHENIVDFIESYIAHSSITEPKSPFSFLREGNYINGSQVQTANPIPADRVGEAWEEQVKKMGGVPDFAPADPTFNESRIGLPEVLGQPNDPIPTHTIFDQESRVMPNEDSSATPYRFEYDGYSRF
ncbi:MAG: hypothetical protein A4S09_11170 [Proteobacteria bacterium SG_bin7]|nr:MAG: hypothetical protein A4S09_11170 [Proteobacteria bacterium SG_bin7]